MQKWTSLRRKLMQKLINVLALASFGVSAAAVGAGIYLYQNKDALIDAAVEMAMEQIELPGIDALGADAIPSPTGAISTPNRGGGLPPITLPF